MNYRADKFAVFISGRQCGKTHTHKLFMEYHMNETILIEDQHVDMVRRLAKPGEQIVTDITPEKAHLLHMVVGISGEAGELLDAVKKHVVYNKPLDVENVIEELGDIEFYMAGLRDALGLSREGTLRHNLEKLNKRYGHTYSNEAAQQRADKVDMPDPPFGCREHHDRIELPKYKSHKIVSAVKIAAVEIDNNGSAKIAPEDLDMRTLFTKPGWASRFKSKNDDLGYFVVYEDGYESWSPTKAFEEGYTLIND